MQLAILSELEMISDATEETGPREPWHDCHAKVVGPTAHDIKKNFEERWRKQNNKQADKLFSIRSDSDFIKFDTPAPLVSINSGDTGRLSACDEASGSRNVSLSALGKCKVSRLASLSNQE